MYTGSTRWSTAHDKKMAAEFASPALLQLLPTTSTWVELIEVTTFVAITVPILNRKFYKYIMNFLVGVAVTNAVIMFRISHTQKTPSKSFMKFLELSLSVITPVDARQVECVTKFSHSLYYISQPKFIVQTPKGSENDVPYTRRNNIAVTLRGCVMTVESGFATQSLLSTMAQKDYNDFVVPLSHFSHSLSKAFIKANHAYM